MAEEKSKKKNILQFIKFALFSASAGLIQAGSFTLMNEVIIKLPFFQNAMANNPTFAKIMENEYGPMYLIALLLSVIWNFTFNRKFTFKSAANVPISTIIGNHITATHHTAPVMYIVLGVTMVTNMVTEFLFDKFVVFRNQENTAVKKDKITE